MLIDLVLNGERRRIEAGPADSLLDLLRLRLAIRSVKRGCPPLGQCGACLALVNGEPRVTCTIPAASAAGCEVLTLEGVAAPERECLARAFAAAGGIQCGFCTPGIVLRAKHLLDQNPDPTRAEIAAALDEHLCRCTGYLGIVDAIALAARARRGQPLPAPVAAGGVGARLERVGAHELALGTRAFVDDLAPPEMLHGAVMLAAHARARVLRIDTARARAHPGVVRVATAHDVPGERWNGLILEDWPAFVAEGEETRCVGDVLAAVAAESEAAAR